MKRAILLAAVVVGFGPIASAQAIEIVNESDKTVVVCLHRQFSRDVGANFELIVHEWVSEGWWSVKPGQTLKLPDGRNDALVWMRLSFDSAKGTVIKPAKPAAGPGTLPVHEKVFRIQRVGPDKDDTWMLVIDKKLINGGNKMTSGDAVKNHGCWIADGFYGYKANTKFTVK